MIVVLAEKPSVARDIAAVLGANNKRDGYFEGNNYQVTYAFGHLVTIAEPEEMNPAWRGWRLDQLPMIPSQWKYRVDDQAQSKAQFNRIKALFLSSATTVIICATDAGREGQHIFDLIYQLTGSTKPVQRLWISSLTPAAIRAGFRDLKPASDFANLSAAAAWRARADWMVGLSATRAYTLINGEKCPVGRVQTPTLALIVSRQHEIDTFKSSTFYEIHVLFEPGFTAKYVTPGEDPQTRLQQRSDAQAIVDQITTIPNGVVQSVTTTEKITKAPPLFDLLTLQKESNKRFGYTAQETLDIAQSLYEEYKLLSYPRTESRHLSPDMVPVLPGILRGLPEEWPVEAALALANGLQLSKTYVDNAKLTDHHAIIPTHKRAGKDLPEKQRNIYELVAARFVSIFLPAEVRDETLVLIQLGQHSFRALGCVIKQPGWTVIGAHAPTEKKPEDDGQQVLPALTQDQPVAKRNAQIKQGKTAPPKPYDDASLLTAMKNAGQQIEDQDLAAHMKQSGLGTPATRAAIIEKLIASGCIERKRKSLAPTEKGKTLIGLVHPTLKDVAMTASWEQELANIKDGTEPAESFAQAIAQFLCTIFPELVAVSPKPTAKSTDPNAYGPCPKCKLGTIRKTKMGAGCSRFREGCTFSIWREMNGKRLTNEHIRQLVIEGQTDLIKGFKKRDRIGTYDARLVVSPKFKIKTTI